MTDEPALLAAAQPVRQAIIPLASYFRGGAIIGPCVWIVRTEYDDGTTTIEYQQAEPPP